MKYTRQMHSAHEYFDLEVVKNCQREKLRIANTGHILKGRMI